jgi:IclR family transcriptional regulator, KDG regulon repressor
MLLTIGCSGRVLDLFTIECPEWGVTEAAHELQLSKSKAHALLASLADVGLLRRTDRGRYRLGWRVLGLNRVLADTTDFRCHARRVMDALGAHFGETVHLATLDDGRVVYIDRVEGAQAVRIACSTIGSALPAHCTAVGKALLSQLDESDLDEVIARRGLPALTDRSITDTELLRTELSSTRQRGFALDIEETLPEISCTAAPIIGEAGRAVAAISLTAPTCRFERRQEIFEHAIVKSARYIARQLRAAVEPSGEYRLAGARS